MYDVLFFVCVIACSYYVKLSNNLILRSTVLYYITFLSAAIASNLLAVLLFILIKTVAFVNVVELHSIRVVLVSPSRRGNPS
jgi:hypothetical protein